VQELFRFDPQRIPEAGRSGKGDYLANTPTRILVVDDFQPHRSLVATLLRNNPNPMVVSEAADGKEAVAQARELKPDLILLDIGIPKLNGLEAGRQICYLVPSARIIFVSQQTDVDVVREAFNLGAWGYVLKQDAESDLLAALVSVLKGERFVSSGLGDF
jgi:DNA-binding NarL/FixJ family response regulator